MVEKHIDCEEMFRSDFIEGWRQDEAEQKAPPLKFLVANRRLPIRVANGLAT